MNDLSHRWPLGAVLLLIGMATLVPLGGAPPQFYRGSDWADLLVNLCLYLPLGVLLAREKLSPLAIAAIALVLSGSIEMLQATVISGRRGGPVDVASNLLGAMAGLGCQRALMHLWRSPSRSMIAGAALLASLPVVGWLCSGILLAPSPPETRQWWGQWAHHFVGTEPFRGTIVSVALLGTEIPDDPVPSTAALRAKAREEGLELEVTLRSGGTTEGLTHLAGVADGEGHAVIGLEQLGDDLLLSWSSRGAALGLRAPRLVFPTALRAAAGEALTIRATVGGARAVVNVGRSEGRKVGRSRRLTPFAGWRNLIPSRELSAAAQRAFDVVWTLGLAGYLLLAARGLRSLRLSY